MIRLVLCLLLAAAVSRHAPGIRFGAKHRGKVESRVETGSFWWSPMSRADTRHVQFTKTFKDPVIVVSLEQDTVKTMHALVSHVKSTSFLLRLVPWSYQAALPQTRTKVNYMVANRGVSNYGNATLFAEHATVSDAMVHSTILFETTFEKPPVVLTQPINTESPLLVRVAQFTSTYADLYLSGKTKEAIHSVDVISFPQGARAHILSCSSSCAVPRSTSTAFAASLSDTSSKAVSLVLHRNKTHVHVQQRPDESRKFGVMTDRWFNESFVIPNRVMCKDEWTLDPHSERVTIMARVQCVRDFYILMHDHGKRMYKGKGILYNAIFGAYGNKVNMLRVSRHHPKNGAGKRTRLKVCKKEGMTVWVQLDKRTWRFSAGLGTKPGHHVLMDYVAQEIHRRQRPPKQLCLHNLRPGRIEWVRIMENTTSTTIPATPSSLQLRSEGGWDTVSGWTMQGPQPSVSMEIQCTANARVALYGDAWEESSSLQVMFGGGKRRDTVSVGYHGKKAIKAARVPGICTGAWEHVWVLWERQQRTIHLGLGTKVGRRGVFTAHSPGHEHSVQHIALSNRHASFRSIQLGVERGQWATTETPATPEEVTIERTDPIVFETWPSGWNVSGAIRRIDLDVMCEENLWIGLSESRPTADIPLSDAAFQGYLIALDQHLRMGSWGQLGAEVEAKVCTGSWTPLYVEVDTLEGEVRVGSGDAELGRERLRDRLNLGWFAVASTAETSSVQRVRTGTVPSTPKVNDKVGIVQVD